MSSLQVITTHFNPCGYRAPLRNYQAFVRHMESFGVHVRTAELTFDDAAPVIPQSVKFKGSSKTHMLWQKEALLNALIETSTSEYIAWIDSDVWFMNPNWVDEAVTLLRHKTDVVQLFSDARMIDRRGVVSDRKWPSSIAAYLRQEACDDFSYCHPGLAWAARGDWLREYGLYDKLVAGCGDSTMALLWCGKPLCGFNSELLDDVMRWNAPSKPMVGYVSGTVLHMYHGANKNRRRSEQRSFHQLIRPCDLAYDGWPGPLRWTDDADPDVIRRIQQRFVDRQEDDEGVQTGSGLV